jgi:aminotransferase
MSFEWSKKLSAEAKNIKPSGIRRFFDIVATKPDVISLGVGEPDFVTPYNIREAAIRSIQKGYTQYTSNKGLEELRGLVKTYLNAQFGLNYSHDNEIFITVGASEAIDLALRAIVNTGDEVIIPEPSYVSYAPCVSLTRGVPVVVRTVRENSFKLTPAELEKVITKKTKALILPYPNNPTGAIMTKADLEAIVPIIKKHNLVVISDEIYGELSYTVQHTSIASLQGMRERTILLNGFSKAFAMTGWRLGFVAAPEEICSCMLRIHQYVIMCAPTASQFAAVEALKAGLSDGFSAVGEMKAEYDKRRRLMHHGLNEAGLDCFLPEGAFYCFPDVSSLGLSGTEFAERLLEKKEVAVVPGDAFGEFGKSFVRCCYATSLKNITEALRRIREFVINA